MNIKELDKLAKEKAPMPNGLPMYEQCYYIASRGLYDQYAHQIITLEQAKKEKKEVIRQYEEGKHQWELFMSMYEVEEKLSKLKEEGFNSFLEFEILEILEKILK